MKETIKIYNRNLVKNYKFNRINSGNFIKLNNFNDKYIYQIIEFNYWYLVD